jgi:hypothetical protein
MFVLQSSSYTTTIKLKLTELTQKIVESVPLWRWEVHRPTTKSKATGKE